MDRRAFLKTAGASAALLASGGVPAAKAATRKASAHTAADDGALPSLVWLPTSLTPALTLTTNAADVNTQRGFATLLPVRNKLGSAALDNWYLWLWTHDTSRTYLYTAPTPMGPYTAQGFAAAPTPYPTGYLVNHFSSGDIVWDAPNERFISSPHGVRLPLDGLPGNGEPCQDSFITTSRDGQSWEWLDGDNRPRLVCGPPYSVDSVHTGYGRLLRDIDGNLTHHAGRNWWIYRAQRKDAGHPLAPYIRAAGTTYTPYLASAPSINDDFTQKQKAFDSPTLNIGLNNFGSFIHAGNSHHVYTAQGLPDPPIAPVKVLYNKTSGDNMEFLPVPIPFVLPTLTTGALIEGDGNVIRDPESGAIYLCHTVGIFALPSLAPTVEVWIYRGVLP